jgi:site-specific DNA-methyltransferase (adenine-specific)
MVQLSLITDDHIKKTIITVPIGRLKISEYNPRKERHKDDITRLAERISRNGFEITRALWAERNGEGYEVFAGGTRLQAARLAMLTEVPVVLHEGLTEDDKVRLADEDNENDEYHESVGPVDIWANYAWLNSLPGWTQDRIAKAKGLKSHKLVSVRIKLHNLPDKIKAFVTQDKLNEKHLREISTLGPGSQLSDWLTAKNIQFELCQESVKRSMTTRQTKDLVTKTRSMIETAQDSYNKRKTRQEKFEADNDTKFPDRYHDLFVSQLAADIARTKAAVSRAYSDQLKNFQDAVHQYELELTRQRDAAKAEVLRIEQEAEKERLIQGVLDNIILGDLAEVLPTLPDESIDAIITDPPYPKEFLPLYETLAIQAARLLKPGGSLLVMCGQSYLPEIFNMIIPYIDYRWLFSYQTPGGQSPQIWNHKINAFWKPVIWFTKGEYHGDWHGDVIKSDANDKKHHHWGQSESGMSRIIDGFTEPGQTILDPFLGGGTTGIISIEMGRDFIGCDIDKGSIETTKDRLYSMLKGGRNG